MGMMFHLLDHPNPNGPHYRPRTKPIRLVVLHTAENNTDMDGADSGAEAVAAYASSTTRQVSWHATVDSDSTIMMLPDNMEAYHVRGYNDISLGLEFATKAADWVNIPYERRIAMLDRGAAVVAEWCHRHQIPAVHTSKKDVDAGGAGIIGHHLLDPTRRSDPGQAFPWQWFLERVQEKIRQWEHIGTPVMGTSKATVEQMVSFAIGRSLGAAYPPDTIDEIVYATDRIAREEGVRGDLALALMLKETGNFHYGGDVRSDQWNFGGIGATGGVPGNSFPTLEAGVRAVVRRMHLYAVNNPELHSVTILGRPLGAAHWGRYPMIEDFNGVWAVPGVGYGESIVKLADLMAAQPALKNQPPLDDGELSLLRRIMDWFKRGNL